MSNQEQRLFLSGKEEYADIGIEEEDGAGCCCHGHDSSTNATVAAPVKPPPNPGGNPFVRPAPGIFQNLATIAPLPEDQDDMLSHRFGIYVWAFYQVL